MTIQIAQYEMLVAAACAGLNSIISLGAICLFYGYLRHRTNLRAFAVIALSVIPIAVFSNFIRVIILILITYYLGEAAAQGFLHDFAGSDDVRRRAADRIRHRQHLHPPASPSHRERLRK